MKSSHCNKSVVEGEEKREEEMDEDAVRWTESETGIAAEARWRWGKKTPWPRGDGRWKKSDKSESRTLDRSPNKP